MTRAEKVAKAQELRARGLLLREIAEEMGCAIQTVNGYLNDPDNARLAVRRKKWDHSSKGRGVCLGCGKPKGVSTRQRYLRCRSCQAAAQIAQRTERAQRIALSWAQGRSMREIADELGWTVLHLGAEMARIRRDGLADLPLRYSMKRRAAA